MRVLGTDEAGRGPVIGPMVICGVVSDEASISTLAAMGVKDSKKLTPDRRIRLRDRIVDVVEAYRLVELSPREIDGAVKRRKLNVLEAQKMAELIEGLRPDVAYVDAPSVNPRGYLRLLEGFLNVDVRVVAENRADEKYTVVGAASILAKVRRDEVVRGYHEAYGELGSGYPSDDVTISFLEEYYKAHGVFPEFVRLEWRTRKGILKRIMQRKLDHFAHEKKELNR